MKMLLTPIFLILAAIFLLFGTTIFVAGMLLFLASQAFYDIYFYSGVWAAYFAAIALVALICYSSFLIAKSSSKNFYKPAIKSDLISFTLASKVFISLILYQLLKLFFKKTKGRPYEK